MVVGFTYMPLALTTCGSSLQPFTEKGRKKTNNYFIETRTPITNDAHAPAGIP